MKRGKDMDQQQAREYFLSKQGAVEERPFNDFVPVFKVGGKMFGLINVHEKDRVSINLKYPKEKMAEIRSIIKEVIPGYHMNKDHWNTIYLDGELSEDFVKELIDTSYNLVFTSLTKKKQIEIKEH